MKIKEINENNERRSHQTSSGHNSENNGSEADSQRFEESMFSTIDAVCRSHQETYPQFMSQFMQLKPEHVQGQGLSSSTSEGQGLSSSTSEGQGLFPSTSELNAPPEFFNIQRLQFLQQHSAGRLPNLSHKGADVGACSLPHNSDQDNLQPVKTGDPDVLEEEILEEGSRTQTYLLRPQTVTKNVRIKIGNYIDDDDNDDGHTSEDSDDVYTPSFLPSSAETDLHSPAHVASTSHVTTHSTNQNTIESTNQNTIESTNHNQEDTLCIEAKCSQTTDIDLKSSKTVAQVTGEKLNSVDNSETTVSKQIEIECKITNNKNKTDQSENILDLIRAQDSDDNCDDSDLELDHSQNGLNFGEIGEEPDPELINPKRKWVNNTQLDFKVVSTAEVGGSNTTGQQSECERCTDEVEAFSLDDNFDYDHVTLTPKYNRAEMEILMTAMAGVTPDTRQVLMQNED